MRRSVARFIGGALAGWVAALALNLLPYARSYGNDQHGDLEVIGFPLLFWRGGGWPYRQEFHPALLLADAVVALVFATAWGVLAVHLPQLFGRSRRGFAVSPPSTDGAAAE